MHATELQQIARVHSGVAPANWATGTDNYKKAKVLAAIAWSMIKPAEDPELARCDPTFQESCVARAESIIAGNEPDGPLGFKIRELLNQYNAQVAQKENTPCTSKT